MRRGGIELLVGVVRDVQWGLPSERRDLTELATFTVDPATARDFDDAVSAQREGDGARRLDPHRRRRRPRAPGLAARPRGAAARQQHLRPGRGRADAAARAQQRRLQPRARGRAAGGDGRDRARGRRRGRARPASTAAASAPTPASTTTSSTRSSPAAAAPPEAVAEPLAAARDGRRRARRAARRHQPRGRVGRARVRVRRRGRRRRRPAASPQTESHRLIERLMILTNEQVAQLLSAGGCRRSTASTPSPTRPGRAPDRAAARARHPDAAAAAGLSGAEPGGGDWRPRRAGWSRREAARRGHGREAYTSLVLRSLKQAALQRAQQRPRRARQRRLLPLHLADPPLPGPRRPPGAAGGAGGGGGGAAGSARPARSPATAASASASR